MKVKVNNRYIERYGYHSTLIKVPNTQIKVWMPNGLVFEGRHETALYFPKGAEFKCIEGRKKTKYDAQLLFNRFQEFLAIR